jgi:transposase-like protein
MKYPKCPLCKSDNVRKSILNKTPYWRCWSCKHYFDKDFLFVCVELPIFREQEKKR